MMKRLAPLLVCLAVAACAPQASKQSGPAAEIVLSYGSPYAPTHPFSRADIDWIKHIETASQGRVQIKPYWSGGLLSSEQSMVEIRHGVADIGLITPIYVRGGAHVTSGQTGFYAGADTMDSQVAVYKCLAAEFPAIRNEMAGLKVLAVQGGNLAGIVTRDKPVRTLEDLKGMRLRVPEELLEVLKTMGADPVDMPMAEVYSAMAKGVIDGVIVAPDSLRSLHFAEIAKYYTELEAPRGAYPARAISMDRFRQLPPDIQRLLSDSQTVWEDALETHVVKGAETGVQYGREKKMTFVPVSPQMQDAFNARYTEIIAREAHQLDPYGVDGAAMLARTQALVKQYQPGQPLTCGKPS